MFHSTTPTCHGFRRQRKPRYCRSTYRSVPMLLLDRHLIIAATLDPRCPPRPPRLNIDYALKKKQCQQLAPAPRQPLSLFFFGLPHHYATPLPTSEDAVTVIHKQSRKRMVRPHAVYADTSPRRVCVCFTLYQLSHVPQLPYVQNGTYVYGECARRYAQSPHSALRMENARMRKTKRAIVYMKMWIREEQATAYNVNTDRYPRTGERR